MLEPLLAELAAGIAFRWQVTVLNVIYDQLDVPHKRPRLQLIVEHSRERQEFCDGPNFDPAKQQAIAARFAELVKRQGPTRYDVDGLLVVFSAFAPLAREDANSRVADVERRALQERIANPHLWTIHRSLGRVTFMFYTDEQARTYAQAGCRQTCADRYFELLQKHDEFGYLRRARFPSSSIRRRTSMRTMQATGSTTIGDQMPIAATEPTVRTCRGAPRLIANARRLDQCSRAVVEFLVLRDDARANGLELSIGCWQ